MAASLAWINPGRLLRLQLTGAVTQADIVAVREQLRMMLADVNGKVDYLLDVQAVTEFPESLLRILLDKRGMARSPKTGRFLIIGAKADGRLILESVALALRVEAHYFDDEESALTFAVEC